MMKRQKKIDSFFLLETVMCLCKVVYDIRENVPYPTFQVLRLRPRLLMSEGPEGMHVNPEWERSHVRLWK